EARPSSVAGERCQVAASTPAAALRSQLEAVKARLEDGALAAEELPLGVAAVQRAEAAEEVQEAQEAQEAQAAAAGVRTMFLPAIRQKRSSSPRPDPASASSTPVA